MLKTDLLFWLFVFIALISINQANAATVYIPMPEGATLANGTDIHFKYPFSSNTYESAYPTEKTIPTSKGRVPMTLEHELKPNNSKVGKAVTNFLKKGLPIVSTAAALYQLVCDLSDLCTNPATGNVEKRTVEPTTTSTTFNYQTSGITRSTGLAVCQATVTSWCAPSHISCTGMTYTDQSSTTGQCFANRSDGGSKTSTVNKVVTCPTGYTLTANNNCFNPNAQTTFRPILPADYDNAETPLSVPAIIPRLVENEIPVPVDVPVLKPKSKTVDSTSTTIRDGSGTAIGTETRTTVVNVTPQPNTNPTSLTSPANVTETTTTTTTNITNNTTNSTTTTIELNPQSDESPPEEELEIELDTPADEPPLQEFTPDVDYSDNSWGGGSCPAAPVMSTSKGTYLYNIQPACDFVNSARPIILLLAGLAALYIISGVKTD